MVPHDMQLSHFVVFETRVITQPTISSSTDECKFEPKRAIFYLISQTNGNTKHANRPNLG